MAYGAGGVEFGTFPGYLRERATIVYAVNRSMRDRLGPVRALIPAPKLPNPGISAAEAILKKVCGDRLAR